MRKLLILLILLISLSKYTYSSIPAGYYHEIDSLCGEQLLLKLSEICSKAQYLNYGSGFGSTWYGFFYTDRNQDSTLIDMYSNEIRYFSDYNAINGVHIEHSFPKSWWGGYENYTFKDLHHIFPADAITNIYKNNLPLGIVDNVIYDNGKSKIGTSTLYEGNCFEPSDEYKGDFARAYFYVATIYHNLYHQWNSPMLDNNSYPMWKSWALNLLLSWHYSDPISDKELKRQEVVYNIQHNRNPFIDYPELIDFIWGNNSNNPYRLINDTLPYIASPTIWDVIDLGTNYINTIVSDTISLKWNNLNQNISLKIKNDTSNISISSNIISTKNQSHSNVIIYISSNISKLINDTLLIYSNEIDTLYIPISANFIDCFIITYSKINTPRSFTTSWIKKPNSQPYIIKIYNGYKNASSNLFFSSYIEGSGYNKAISIFNGTGRTINLGDYSLKKQNNGLGDMKNTFHLSGILNNNEYYTICNSKASDSLLNKSNLIIDYLSENNITNFNGNDAIGLYYHDILLDIIGPINDQTMWGENITLIRRNNINAPNITYNANEWNVFPQDYINIENHNISNNTEQLISTIIDSNNSYTFNNLLPNHTYTVEVTDNNNLSSDNAYTVYTPEIEIVDAFPASNISNNSFSANWEKSIFIDKYKIDLLQIEGDGITKVIENFDTINSNGKPLPDNWTGNASGNYTSTSSSGNSPNAIALKNNLEYIQTPIYNNKINNFQFTYKYPSSATGSYFLVLSLDETNTLHTIDSIAYSNTQKQTIKYSNLDNTYSIKIEYHKNKGNLSIDDIEFEYGNNDTIYIDSIFSAQNIATFYSLQDSTSYYYQVKGIINTNHGTYISQPSNIIEVTTLGNTQTSVCNLNKDDIIIYSSENNILIENIPLQSTIKVYDVNGRMIHTNINNTSRYKIQIPTNHIFFIQIITSHSNKTFKILL